MKCTIMHETPGRMRVSLAASSVSLAQADVLEYWLRELPGVAKVTVYDRTGDAIILYEKGIRQAVIERLAGFSFDDPAALSLVPDHTPRALRREYVDKLSLAVARHFLIRLFVPLKIRTLMTIARSYRPIRAGLSLVHQGRVEVPVLDATAITMAMIQGDFATATSIMFLLEIGDILEDWTHKKSVDDLARSMSLSIDKVWRKNADTEELVPIDEINAGDSIVVRMGHMIPLDGVVIEGEGAVNQASMTGESLPVPKKAGSYVYTGTVVEEGELTLRVDKTMGEGRYDRIVTMIEESEKLKSSTEAKAAHLADSLVPYHLLATGLVYLLTRNITKTMAVLMVDYSCALKLSIPIAVLSAMRDCSEDGMTVKGGKAMEAIADADTIVFDKTGTLTHAVPEVADVLAFGEAPDEVLRLAACLEEHYPHSMAKAVVKAAADKGLVHEERHTAVEYVVAHGIASSVDGEKVIIGSYHFVFEDEGCEMTEEMKEQIDALPGAYSLLYLAKGQKLIGVICITDPVREEAADVIKALHANGFTNVVMMTGDNEKTARTIAESVGVDAYRAEVLPEDKANFIKECREKGHTVIMVGDGVNDTPALSEADVGIAISDGAAIAREIADVMITTDDLRGLVHLRERCKNLMHRIDTSYRTIMSFNTGLIVLGVAGILPPSTSALLHNASTIAISTKNTTKLPVDFIPGRIPV